MKTTNFASRESLTLSALLLDGLLLRGLLLRSTSGRGSAKYAG
jgi:hypothetical protein